MCPGGGAEKSLPSVVCVSERERERESDFYGAYTSAELRLVGYEPEPIGFQAQGGDL